jgi:nitric oxide reductase activation protein
MQLLARRCRQRLLVFITDGKPTDIDIYDSRYLIDDARCAVREAKRKGVVVFCVSLDPSADKYVRHIFGSKNYRVLDQIESLPRLLPQMILRMTA